jgi:anhydro-N-acetylmuramic acid kinase
MFKDYYNVVGVMSGTSLDGIDLAHVKLSYSNNKWDFCILEAETFGYHDNMLKRLQTAVLLSPNELNTLNLDYTLLLSDCIAKFLKKYHLTNIDAICSHGHTVLHQPHKKLTLQIGNIEEIKVRLKPPIVCNFRIQDVQMGGQGAPLVPIGDRLLFADYDYCLNLGGFSNISFETAGGRMAFDISPVNTVLNHYAQQVGIPFDDGGSLASSGLLHDELLDELNKNAYFSKSYPKSLGVEFVLAQVIPLINSFQLPIENILRTYTAHIVAQIARALTNKTGKMLITGGGAYNLFLVDGIQKALPNMEIRIPENKIIEYKEALIFALIGTLRLRNENNILASVTGAPHDHCAGTVYY